MGKTVLVLVSGYPTPDGCRSMYFVHVRSLAYRQRGIWVTVLNFAAKKSYELDGVRVITLNQYRQENASYDLLVCHAANLRNHYLFLKQYGNRFPKKLFFFHGHEILHIANYYPRPYPFVKQNCFKRALQYVYDDFKLRVWHRYYADNIVSIRLVFVSNWLFEQFLSEVKLTRALIGDHVCVIPNSIGRFFETHHYHGAEKRYDFLTIRSNMDASTYCLDIITALAEKNPVYRFCVVGSGRYYNFNPKPDNIEWIQGSLSHEKLADLMDHSTFALMPVREDTQGVMSCEMAAYGLPLITSDLPVTREVFSDCPRVAFIDNQNPDLESAVKGLSASDRTVVWSRYYAENSMEKEIAYLRRFLLEE